MSAMRPRPVGGSSHNAGLPHRDLPSAPHRSASAVPLARQLSASVHAVRTSPRYPTRTSFQFYRKNKTPHGFDRRRAARAGVPDLRWRQGGVDRGRRPRAYRGASVSGLPRWTRSWFRSWCRRTGRRLRKAPGASAPSCPRLLFLPSRSRRSAR